MLGDIADPYGISSIIRDSDQDQCSLRPPSAPLSKALEVNDFRGFCVLGTRRNNPNDHDDRETSSIEYWKVG